MPCEVRGSSSSSSRRDRIRWPSRHDLWCRRRALMRWADAREEQLARTAKLRVSGEGGWSRTVDAHARRLERPTHSVAGLKLRYEASRVEGPFVPGLRERT